MQNQCNLREDAHHNQGDRGKRHAKAQQVGINRIIAAALARTFSLEGHKEHEGNAQETFTPHESDTAVLLAPESFAPMYEAYLCARVDAAQGETALYDADRKRFEAQYARFAAWYNETHLPKRNAAIRVSEPFERR